MIKNPEYKKNYQKEYWQKNKAWIKSKKVLKAYGITLEEWDDLFVSQGRKCAICGEVDPSGWWCGDHDHVTNKFRGILCRVCNVMLGHAKDDPAILQRAIEYLENPPYSIQKADILSDRTCS